MMQAHMPLRIAVVTVSDTRTEANDTSGAALAAYVDKAGHVLCERAILKDELELLRKRVLDYCERDDLDVVLLTGGTGDRKSVV